MKKIGLALSAVAIIAASCQKESQILGNRNLQPLGKTTTLGNKTIGGVVNTGDTLKLWSDTTYKLDSKLYVDSGAVLWIQAGTRIEGVKKQTPSEATAIIVTAGGRIYAMGTASKPIIMTAQTYPNATPGDWGGLVLLGNAGINQTTRQQIEGINGASVPAGIDIHYGNPGNITTDGDNSGIVQYTRIEYAGAAIAPNNELNGLTCGGVGAGTLLTHIEVIYGADDGYEWFGGRVNGDHLISYANNDDQFDFDFGFRGQLQFLVGVISTSIPGITGASNLYSANPNGIESDNDASGSSLTPQTKPNISNLTLVGAKDQATAQSMHLYFGHQWRRNTAFVVRNSIIIGYDTSVNLTSTGTIATMNGITAGANPWRYNVTMAFTKNMTNATAVTTIGNKDLISADGNLRTPGTATTGILVNPFPTDPNALTNGLEPKWATVTTGAKFDGTASSTSGFSVVKFKGGVGNGADNWLYESWVDFTP